MRFRPAWLALPLMGLSSSLALGQGTAVQLPTFSYFGTSTTVSVPDRGSAYLGGVHRARSGASRFGTPLLPFRNRAIGSDHSASSTRVSVFIHDFDAMDEYLLSQPTSSHPYGLQPRASGVALRQPGKGPPKNDSRTVPLLPRGKWDRPSPKPIASVAQLRAKRLREAETRDHEAVDLFHRGRNAEAAGKANVARIYYQMASRRATGPLKTEIQARLDLVRQSAETPRLAQTGR